MGEGRLREERSAELENSVPMSRGDTPARVKLFMRSHRRLLGGIEQGAK